MINVRKKKLLKLDISSPSDVNLVTPIFSEIVLMMLLYGKKDGGSIGTIFKIQNCIVFMLRPNYKTRNSGAVQ